MAESEMVSGHGGVHAVEAAVAHGVDVMFTLSGAHVFPLYDAAVGGPSGVAAAGDPRTAERGARPRLIDVRHEATAVFAAEATARLTCRTGFAVVTAGPGVTNAVTPLTSASFNAAPMLVLGGRSPAFRDGTGSLQELDQPPILAPVTKRAATVREAERIGPAVSEALTLAATPRRGPVFLDVPMDVLYTPVEAPAVPATAPPVLAPDPDAVDDIARLLADASRPVLVLGSDVWAGRADGAARRFAETAGIPVLANGLGRGILPPGHPLLATRARSLALRESDLVIVAGTPLDFRLAYGVFGDPAHPTPVVHLVDGPGEAGRHVPALAAATEADLALTFDALLVAWEHLVRQPDVSAWANQLRAADAAARAADEALLRSDADPVHPARIYGELLPRLTDDTVVVGDGGDFVSWAGRFVEPSLPGRWLDPGPYGALGSGLGYAIGAQIAYPGSPVVLLLGDGSAGFSLMDIDSLVRHGLPVVMVVGNNTAWALEKYPMRLLHGYDVLADLSPSARYSDVAIALGGGGERVSSPGEIGPALDRALASGIPYLVEVMTDAEAAYPRTTTGL